MEKSPDAFRTISEVAVWLETPAHVLRFWESRFPQLKPIKRAGGRRYYRPADMALLGGIKKLLHEDGLTIRGVQKILREQGVRHVATLSGTLDAAELGALLEHDDFPADDPEDAAGIALDVAELPLDQSPGSNVFALPASAVPVGELSRGGRPARTVPATAIPVPADPAPPLGALGLSPDPAPLAGPDGLADEADGEDRSRSLWSDRSAAAVPDPDRDEGQSEDGPQQAPLAPPASHGAFAPSGQAGAEDPAPLGDADTATSIANVVPDAVASGDGEPAADHRLPVVGDAGAVADAPPEDTLEPVALPEPVPPPPVPSPVPRTDPGTRADAAPYRVPLAILLRRLPDSPDPAALGALRALADRLGALRGRLGPQQD